MNSQTLKAILTMALRPKLAAGALIFALTQFSTTASAKLEPETFQLVTKIAAEIPSGIKGSRMSERYYRYNEQLMENFKERCEGLLLSLDPSVKVDSEDSFDYVRHRLRGPRTSAKEFNHFSRAQRVGTLIDFLENLDGLLEHLGSEVQVTRVFDELLAIPYDQLEEVVDGSPYERHWSGANVGPEINTSPFDAMAIQKKLGPMKGKMIDVGSGYAVPGLIFSLFNPKLDYTGLELVPEKIAVAKKLGHRFGVSGMQFRQTDLSSPVFTMPEADYYYMFNPVSREVTDALFHQLNALAARKKIRLILNGSWGDTTILENFGSPDTIRLKDGFHIYVFKSLAD